MYYAIDIRHNTNLRFLHFGRIKLNQLSKYHKIKPVVWMQMVVSQINSSQIKELRFLIEVDFFHDLKQINWNLLENLFAQPHFSGLKKIWFDGVWIRRKLPACDARGILRFRDTCSLRCPEK